jgi:hypothetical protein
MVVSGALANNHTEFELQAFVVRLPLNPEWLKKHSFNQINLGCSIDGSPLHTFSLTAREYPVAPEQINSVVTLLKHTVNAYNNEALKEGRYKLTSHSETTTNRLGINCVEYNKSWVDYGGISTLNKKLLMVAHGSICIHPDSSDRLIEINYSSRNLSGNIPQELINEGEAFINSLQALPIDEKPKKTK